MSEAAIVIVLLAFTVVLSIESWRMNKRHRAEMALKVKEFEAMRELRSREIEEIGQLKLREIQQIKTYRETVETLRRAFEAQSKEYQACKARLEYQNKGK